MDFIVGCILFLSEKNQRDMKERRNWNVWRQKKKEEMNGDYRETNNESFIQWRQLDNP